VASVSKVSKDARISVRVATIFRIRTSGDGNSFGECASKFFVEEPAIRRAAACAVVAAGAIVADSVFISASVFLAAERCDSSRR
jgi:hypothetical protein